MFKPVEVRDADGELMVGLSQYDKKSIVHDTKEWYANNPLAWDERLGVCVYHSEDGAMCAVGRLDAKDKLLQDIEGTVTCNEVQAKLAVVLFGPEYSGCTITPDTNKFLRALQKAHDDAAESTFIYADPREMMNIKLDYLAGLVSPLVNCL